MLTIYTNVKTRKHYDAYGNFFPDGMPRVFFKAREKVVWQLCEETPEDVTPDTLTDMDSEEYDPQWKPYTGYADFTSIGAYLTADSDFRLKRQGSLKEAVPAGSVATVKADIDGAGYDTIPSSGVLTLFAEDGTWEEGSYDSRTISGSTVTFTMAAGTTFANSYAQGAEMDCYESYYMQASLDTSESDVANGTFVFEITAFSEKLRRAIVYSDVRELDISALELAIFSIDDGSDTVTDLERYMVETFSIRAGLADTSVGVPVTEQTENEAVTMLRTLMASGCELQFSADGENWHATQNVGTDSFYRFRIRGGGGAWSDPVQIVNGTDGTDGVSDHTYVAYASDSAGADFSLTPTDLLKYRGEIHVASTIETPTSSDFADAVWVRYIGSDGEPGLDGMTPTISAGGVQTLPAGSSATASITGTTPYLSLNLGIPKGSDGLTPNLTIGGVQTLPAGSSATASITGTAPNFSLNLGIPKGSDGQGTGNVTWGGISGTLSNQADLSSALSLKQDAITDSNKLPYSRVSGGPTVGSGLLTISSGGSVWTFGANQSSGTNINLGSGGGGTARIYDNPASGGTTTFDYASGDYHRLSLSSDLIIYSASNLPVGGGMVLDVNVSSHQVATYNGTVIVSSGQSGHYLIGLFQPASGYPWVFLNAAAVERIIID